MGDLGVTIPASLLCLLKGSLFFTFDNQKNDQQKNLENQENAYEEIND